MRERLQYPTTEKKNVLDPAISLPSNIALNWLGKGRGGKGGGIQIAKVFRENSSFLPPIEGNAGWRHTCPRHKNGLKKFRAFPWETRGRGGGEEGPGYRKGGGEGGYEKNSCSLHALAPLPLSHPIPRAPASINRRFPLREKKVFSSLRLGGVGGGEGLLANVPWVVCCTNHGGDTNLLPRMHCFPSGAKSVVHEYSLAKLRDTFESFRISTYHHRRNFQEVVGGVSLD